MGNTNLPILCNIAQCDSDCMCVRVASYSTYFPCHHNITATVLILLVTSEQLTLSRAELLSGLSSKSLTPSLPLSTHTHTYIIETWTYTYSCQHTHVFATRACPKSHTVYPHTYFTTLRWSLVLYTHYYTETHFHMPQHVRKYGVNWQTFKLILHSAVLSDGVKVYHLTDCGGTQCVHVLLCGRVFNL